MSDLDDDFIKITTSEQTDTQMPTDPISAAPTESIADASSKDKATADQSYQSRVESDEDVNDPPIMTPPESSSTASPHPHDQQERPRRVCSRRDRYTGPNPLHQGAPGASDWSGPFTPFHHGHRPTHPGFPHHPHHPPSHPHHHPPHPHEPPHHIYPGGPGSRRSSHDHHHDHRRGPRPHAPPPFLQHIMDEVNKISNDASQYQGITPNKISEFISQLLGQTTGAPASSNSDHNDFTPDIDLFDHAGVYTIHVSLPGGRKEDIGVHWEADKSALLISGVIHRPEVDESLLRNIVVGERKFGVFERRLVLGDGNTGDPMLVDPQQIKARMVDGVLIVTVPRKIEDQGQVHKVVVR